jgi:NAD(P)-dependent dehydrogenase (short-subunit alcohol dehydrogenase family)
VNGEQRAALVTGAASGIGAAIASWLQGDGWNVLTVDIRGMKMVLEVAVRGRA